MQLQDFNEVTNYLNTNFTLFNLVLLLEDFNGSAGCICVYG